MKTLYSIISTMKNEEIEYKFEGKANADSNTNKPYSEPIGERRCEITRKTEMFSKDLLNEYGKDGLTKVTITFETGKLETEENISNPLKRFLDNIYTHTIKYFSGLK
ncbi:MAG: hypothetical protein Q7S33_02845 [Nanoarchaeota archaeon]|nr:hypothetical protein [Nanoarchaeota archaeon]